jgi:NADH:ubiquinone reductase (H+-translocating)
MNNDISTISHKQGVDTPQPIPSVVIVGAGFGGLRVTSRLRNAPVRVTLIDRRNYHLFQPFLYQVATAALGPTDIAQPIRAILRGQKNLDFRVAEVAGVDLEARKLHLDAGDLAYDFLVIAVGGQMNYFGNRSLSRHAFGLKDLDDAVRIRNHVLNMFELAVHEKDPEIRRALLTFVIVGGGPTGVECAGAFSELIRLVLVKDYLGVSMKDVRVVLLEADNKLLSMMPEGLREAAAETLWSKYVEVRFGAHVSDYDGQSVTLKSGEKIPAHTMVWAAGVRAEELAAKLGSPVDRLGRVKVGRTLQLPNHPEVFVIGDAASPEDGNGQGLPMVAPVAIQEGELAARNILRTVGKQPLEEFKYKDPGALATIGRNAAVARLGRLHLRGFFAWIMWLGVHIVFLIGFRNRLLVLINWAWDYFFTDRPIRLIMHDGNCPWTRVFREELRPGAPPAGQER